LAIYALDSLVPIISESAYVHPEAVVIGDVVIAEEASVWPGAIVRGDYGSIRIGARSSIQDGSVIHSTEDWPTIIGKDCVVGHLVHLEGCTVEDRCLIGSGAVVLNRAVVGKGSVVGAQALVKEDAVIPAGSVALGIPAHVRSRVDGTTASWLDYAIETYRFNAKRYRTGLRRCEPEVS